MNGRGQDSGDNPLDADLARRYRAASAELNEQPAASARAAILAAAAREVQARPVSATAPPRTHTRAPGRTRWPLAAAAAVMLSTLAVMLAIRTEDEMPRFDSVQAPASRVAESAAPAPASRPVAPVDPLTRQPEAMQAPVERRQVAPLEEARKAPARGSDAPAESQRAKTTAEPAPAPSAATDRAQSAAEGAANTERAQSPAASGSAATPAAAAPPSPASVPLSKLRAEEAEASAAARLRNNEQADGAVFDRRRDSARASVPAAAAKREFNQSEEPAAMWLERIIKLRRDGRHAEADAELKRFSERYPQVQLPTEALPATGTR